MDIESRLIYALLTANANEQRDYFNQKIPEGLFKLRAKEIHWVYSYRRSTGSLPSVFLFEKNFKEKLPRHKDALVPTLLVVQDHAMYSAMKDVSERTLKMTQSGRPMSEAMAFFRSSAQRLQIFANTGTDLHVAKSTVADARYRDRVKMYQDGKSLIDTPWATCNRLVGHYSAGDVIVLAARTSIGKTWFVVDWATYLADKGHKSLFISKEMLTEAINDRFEVRRYKLPWSLFRTGDLPPAILRRWREERRRNVHHTDLIISGDETIEGTTLESVDQKIEEHKPVIVWLDGAYLFRSPELGRNSSDVERMRWLSNRCKALAKARHVIIVAVVQLNRKAENKKTGSTDGGLADIYNSDQFAQDADGVYILNGQRGSPRRTVSVAKGRESNVGDFTINFKLDPYPDFSEVQSAASLTAGNSISFKTVV
jgi:replicative DNA helicase